MRQQHQQANPLSPSYPTPQCVCVHRSIGPVDTIWHYPLKLVSYLCYPDAAPPSPLVTDPAATGSSCLIFCHPDLQALRQRQQAHQSQHQHLAATQHNPRLGDGTLGGGSLGGDRVGMGGGLNQRTMGGAGISGNNWASGLGGQCFSARLSLCPFYVMMWMAKALCLIFLL